MIKQAFRPVARLIAAIAVLAMLAAFFPAFTAGQQADAELDGSGCWTANQEEFGDDGAKSWSSPPELVIDPANSYVATLATSAGDIEIELYAAEAPVTVNNFVCLALAGYYDDTPVHRIVQGFVIQAGDPTGTGTGGPGYEFDDEPISPDRDYVKGAVAMANAGPDTNGSQFFICSDDLSGSLDKDYTIFGQVVSGMDVVDELDGVPTEDRNGEKSSPIDPVTLEEVSIATTGSSELPPSDEERQSELEARVAEIYTAVAESESQ